MILVDYEYIFHLFIHESFLSVTSVLGILLCARLTVGQCKISYWIHKDYILEKTMTKETKLFWFSNKGKK